MEGAGAVQATSWQRNQHAFHNNKKVKEEDKVQKKGSEEKEEEAVGDEEGRSCRGRGE